MLSLPLLRLPTCLALRHQFRINDKAERGLVLVSDPRARAGDEIEIRT